MEKVNSEKIRLGKYLHEIVTVKDSTGKVIHQAVRPLMLEFHLRDVVQIIVGATILAIPVALTEEVWYLGENLPWFNVGLIVVLSILFISIFVYYNYYRHSFSKNWGHFLKRTITTYLLSVLIVAVFLMIIQEADWVLWQISLKKVLIIALPASMSAVVADVIK